MSNWDFAVFTGNPDADRATVETYRQQAAAQGLQIDVQPLPTGGYRFRAWAGPPAQPQQAAWGQAPAQPQQAAWGQPQAQPQQASWGQPQAGGPGSFAGPQASMGGSPGFAGAAAVSPPFASATSGAAVTETPIDAQRVTYLRKVYTLLAGSALFAIVAGMLCITVGPTETFTTHDGIPVQVPIVVAMLLGNQIMWLAAFGVLMGATFVASWVSKVKGINVIALFAVAAIMGLELAPMVFVANVLAGLGRTVTVDPVRDAFIMVGAVFAGITTYIFITKKDFSYLRASLSMGFFVIFAASILAMFMGSEPFSLAVAAGGSVLSAGFLLYVTSYIFRNSAMDDPVGDALALLVQLRNLFMFILRMFMSSRD